jgi:hypothetical protein
MKASIAALCDGTAWSCWLPLKDSWLGDTLPNCSGLYRIRLVSKTQCQITYIGQSGSGLKERIYALRHVYDDLLMPYKAPYTAGPSLWAWRHKVPDSLWVPGSRSGNMESSTLVAFSQSLKSTMEQYATVSGTTFKHHHAVPLNKQRLQVECFGNRWSSKSNAAPLSIQEE